MSKSAAPSPLKTNEKQDEEFLEQSQLAARKAAEKEAEAEAKESKEQEKKPESKEKPDLSAVSAWAESFSKGEVSPQPGAKKDDQEKAAKAKEEEEAKAKEVKAKEKKPVRRAPPRPEITPESIAAAAAEGVAKVLAEKQASVEKKPEEISEGPVLSAENQRRYSVIQNMEKLYPDKYKGLPDQFLASTAALEKYASDWEANHPGETFDENDEQHAEFFEAHPVDWDDDDYTESLADLRAQKLVQAERQKNSEEITELKNKERIREETPKIVGLQLDSARKFWNTMGSELNDVIKEDGSVNREKLEELHKQDPVVAAIMVDNANRLAAETATFYRVMNSLERFDERNPMHQFLSDFAEKAEQRMMRQPAEDRLNAEGLPFLPASKFYKLTKADQKKHWTYSPEDYAVLLAHETAKRASDQIKVEDDKFAKRAAARGIALDQRSAPAPARTTEEEAIQAARKPVSPSAAGPSKLAASKEGKRGGEPNSLNAWARDFVQPS